MTNCNYLEKIIVDKSNTKFFSEDNILYNYSKDTLIKYPSANKKPKFKCPGEVRKINSNAFLKCRNLTEVHLDDILEFIGNKAFSNCGILKKDRLSKNIKYIGKDVFKDCILLEEIYVDQATLQRIKTVRHS